LQVKIKGRRYDASVLEVDDWPQMSDWIAELRDDDLAESAGDDLSESAGDDLAEFAGHSAPGPATPAAAAPANRVIASAEASARHEARARYEARARAEAIARHEASARAEASARYQARARYEASARAAAIARHETSARAAALARHETLARHVAIARAEVTERAAIGDQLRIPIAWCEFGSCISHHADSAALGEADARARAISSGWRIDAFGRLACPGCQQSDVSFRVSQPVALWDRDTAITRALLMTAAAVAGSWRPPPESAVEPLNTGDRLAIRGGVRGDLPTARRHDEGVRRHDEGMHAGRTRAHAPA
jgi:hypothetical protein